MLPNESHPPPNAVADDDAAMGAGAGAGAGEGADEPNGSLPNAPNGFPLALALAEGACVDLSGGIDAGAGAANAVLPKGSLLVAIDAPNAPNPLALALAGVVLECAVGPTVEDVGEKGSWLPVLLPVPKAANASAPADTAVATAAGLVAANDNAAVLVLAATA